MVGPDRMDRMDTVSGVVHEITRKAKEPSMECACQVSRQKWLLHDRIGDCLRERQVRLQVRDAVRLEG